MFVQSKSTIDVKHKNGIALKQRRAHAETLVQWENGHQRWVPTVDLVGTIRLIDSGDHSPDNYDQVGV